MIDFVVLTVIAFGERKLGILSYIAKKVVYTVIGLEEIIVNIYDLARSRMYLFGIISYISVLF